MNTKVKDLIKRGYDGPLIGLEIEVEGEGLPNQVRGWRVEQDGSLRGENCEYVFPAPQGIKEAEYLLKKLNLSFLRSGANVKDTGYAGIHCHVNVGDMTWRQLVRFASFWYVMEPLLLRFSGEGRTDNLFCVGLSSAKLPLIYIREALNNASLRTLETDEIRYAALNWKALPQYGSLEFRSMRSTLERDVILKWCKILLELREQALIDRPIDWVVSNTSIMGADFIKQILPTMYEVFDNYDDVKESLLEGVRNIQVFLATLDEAVIDKWWDKRAMPKEEGGGKIPFPRDEIFMRGADVRRAAWDEVPVPNPRAEIAQPFNEPEEDI